MSVEAWAAARLVRGDGFAVRAVEARADYLGWHSEGGPGAGRPEASAKLNAAIVRFGGQRKLRSPDGQKGLCFLGVKLPPPAVGENRIVHEPTTEASPEAVRASLSALSASGVVRDGVALDQALARLTGGFGTLCRLCGRMTGRKRAHLVCVKRLQAQRSRP